MGQKTALERGRLGEMGGRQGVGMNAGEGQVPEHEPQLAAELLLQPLDGAEGQAAVGALVVAVLDQCDGGVLTAAPMVAVGVYRRREILHDRAHPTISCTASNVCR
jgi:hypothetical protein